MKAVWGAMCQPALTLSLTVPPANVSLLSELNRGGRTGYWLMATPFAGPTMAGTRCRMPTLSNRYARVGYRATYHRGSYIVISHHTGERFTGFQVPLRSCEVQATYMDAPMIATIDLRTGLLTYIRRL